MKTVELSKATKPLASYVQGAKSEALVVTRGGKPQVAVIDVRGVDKETLSLSTNPKFLAILERSRDRLRTEGGIPLEEIKRKYGLTNKKRSRKKRPK